jgi:hypothetical protein
MKIKWKIIDKITGEILESNNINAMFEELTTRRKNYFKNGYYINIKTTKENNTRIFAITKKD